MYPQILVVADDMHGIDFFNAYRSSMTHQKVRLCRIGDQSLDSMTSHINSSDVVVISSLNSENFKELSDIIQHSRLISINAFSDNTCGRYLSVKPSAPFPEKFGHSGIDGMKYDLSTFIGRLKKIDGPFKIDRHIMISLWNQFTTDMKSSLAFFRNCTVSPKLNTTPLYGSHIVSNKKIIDGVDIELFDEFNCESFNRSILSVYVRNQPRTQLEYWKNIEISPSRFISVYNDQTDELIYQRFDGSITKIHGDSILFPHTESWPIVVQLDGSEVESASLMNGDIDLFEIIPPHERESVEIFEVIQDLDDLIDDISDDFIRLQDDDEEPNLDFYHSIIA